MQNEQAEEWKTSLGSDQDEFFKKVKLLKFQGSNNKNEIHKASTFVYKGMKLM